MDIATQRKRVEAVKQMRYEAHQAHEYQERLRDELTDQSERLAMPMENSFEYHLRPDGHLYSEYGLELTTVAKEGLDDAEAAVQWHPEWHFELERRKLDVWRVGRYEKLARRELGTATMAMYVSPIPDVVVSGEVNIGGYDKVRKKAIVSIASQAPNGIDITYFSLDDSNKLALQAMAQEAGYDLDPNASSEDIAAQEFQLYVHPKFIKQTVTKLRGAYDASLSEQFGGEWHAGRRFASKVDALTFIKSQPDLISQHMKAVEDIMARVLDKKSRIELLKGARYNFAAALDDVLNGKSVTSVEGAGDGARSEGKTFDGDCPPTLGTTEGQMQAQGMMQGNLLSCVTCPFCKETVDAKIVAGGIKCPDCDAEVRGGKVVNYGKKHRAKNVGTQALKPILQQARSQQSSSVTASPKTSNVIDIAGRRAKKQRRIVVGGIDESYVDAVTGEKIAA